MLAGFYLGIQGVQEFMGNQLFLFNVEFYVSGSRWCCRLVDSTGSVRNCSGN